MSEARPPYINAATATLTAPRIAPTFFGRNTQALDNNNLASPTTLCLPPAACLAGHTSSPTLSFMSGVDSAAQLPSTSKEERAKAEPPNLTAQQQAQLTALLNFRPSSRDVISGIAPHVFDDQRSSWRAVPRRLHRTGARSAYLQLYPSTSTAPSLIPREMRTLSWQCILRRRRTPPHYRLRLSSRLRPFHPSPRLHIIKQPRAAASGSSSRRSSSASSRRTSASLSLNRRASLTTPSIQTPPCHIYHHRLSFHQKPNS
ncbi:hypothetical protein C8R45DRAFT_1030652 [Mycena sanguinolenta]|nr:hypothetical protein C8R45DRAFT_1030652 [Mycena sanguinolenta]